MQSAGSIDLLKMSVRFAQVTCGGVQSAHTAAVAAACAERGIRAHLLVRGERPAIPTGHHLLARMFGHVTHVTRQEYSDRAALLAKHEKIVAQKYPEGKVSAYICRVDQKEDVEAGHGSSALSTETITKHASESHF